MFGFLKKKEVEKINIYINGTPHEVSMTISKDELLTGMKHMGLIGDQDELMTVTLRGVEYHAIVPGSKIAEVVRIVFGK